MYPATYYSLFPAFPRTHTAFVAMSFEPPFTLRWEKVLSAAIASVQLGAEALQPVRVDARVVGDSILTEILQGISTAQVVLADVTSVGITDGRPIRNGNVMYEVGIAHAVRLPEEVLLFRSDQDPLLFDTANVRVNHYRPDEDPENAKRQVADAIMQALREVDLRRHLSVRAAADSLDYPSFRVLNSCQSKGEVIHPERRTMGDALFAVTQEAALQRLLGSGLLRAKPFLPADGDASAFLAGPSSGVIRYEMTRFGQAVLKEFLLRYDASKIAGLVKADL